MDTELPSLKFEWEAIQVRLLKKKVNLDFYVTFLTPKHSQHI